MKQRESAASDPVLGLSMPVFLAIWLVCAVVAGISWENLVTNTPASTPLHSTFLARIVLSVSFGLPGAGFISMAVGLFRGGY